MLVLSRRATEKIVIDGRIILKTVRFDRDVVTIEVKVPTEMPIRLEETGNPVPREGDWIIFHRKLNECIFLGDRIVIRVLRIAKDENQRDVVKLGIQAPSELPVHREEIYDIIQRNKQASGT